MGEGVPNRTLRVLVVLGVTLIGTSPFAVFLFIMGLVAAEEVIYPTATLATGAISALIASWAANLFAVDERRTDLARVVTHNVMWAIPMAVTTIFLPPYLDSPMWLIAGVIAYCGVIATILAFRRRTDEADAAADGQLTVGWLLGTAVGFGLVIFVASLFGLTGA